MDRSIQIGLMSKNSCKWSCFQVVYVTSNRISYLLVDLKKLCWPKHRLFLNFFTCSVINSMTHNYVNSFILIVFETIFFQTMWLVFLPSAARYYFRTRTGILVDNENNNRNAVFHFCISIFILFSRFRKVISPSMTTLHIGSRFEILCIR
jgi:hypothetical protein